MNLSPAGLRPPLALPHFFRLLALLCACSVSTAFAQGSAAKAYPTQPIRLVVAGTPGTSMDIVARIIEPELSQRLGQPVIVDNRAGASGIIGTDFVAKSASDGYTLLLGAQSMVVVPLLVHTARYNPLTDFAPISLVATGTLLLVTNPKSGFSTVAEMIAQAKAHPDQISYSSPGVGLPQHLVMELLANNADIQLFHVPYKGSSGAVVDLMSGQVALSLVPLQMALPYLKSGKLKALAVASPHRDAKLPEVPTLQEAGIKGVDEAATLSNFFMAPKGTPAPIVARINTELRTIMAMPDVKEKLESNGFAVATSSPAELQAMLDRASTTFGGIIRENHISME